MIPAFGIAMAALALLGAAPRVVPPDAGLEQRPGAQLPADVELRDESGHERHFGELWRGRPLVLVFAYFRCPNLCPLVLQDLGAGLAKAGILAGRDAQVVVVSVDPADDPAAAAAKKAALRIDSAWTFLTGAASETRRLADAVGFHYAKDPKSGEIRHAALVVVATPEGRVSRYLPGLDVPARDLRLAVVEAGQGTVGRPLDRLLLFCFHYDASTGRYGAAVGRLLKLFGSASMLAVGAFVWRSSRPRSGAQA